MRLSPRTDERRLAAFAAAHPQWAGGDWIRAVQEAHIYTERPAPQVAAALFAANPPRTPAGKLAAARAALDAGRREEATATARALWRDGDFDGWTETAILKDFGSALTRADHKYRADRLLYAEKMGAALRAAARAGADEAALAQARIAAMTGPLTPRALAAVPAALQNDPGLIFAHVQDARRANRALEAADWLIRAPKAASALIDPDKWWTERRMVARELLDLGQIEKAYAICADAQPVSIPARVDAAFHAGWIALRFANDPERAARHFAIAGEAAETPLSIARAAYWQGRAAEALGHADEARGFYERAANWPIAYYGQLAAKRLGRELVLRAPAAVATGDSATKRRALSPCSTPPGSTTSRRRSPRRRADYGATKPNSPRWPTSSRRTATPRPASISARSSPSAASRSTMSPFRSAGFRTSPRSRVRPISRASTPSRARRANSSGAPPRGRGPRG